jgi:hypothetical protein
MGIVRVLPDVEDRLDADAESWSALPDREYVALVRRWHDGFLPLIAAVAPSSQGDRAMQALADRLPADVWLFSGVQVPELENAGGRGAAGYRAAGLRSMRRGLANRLELVAVAADHSWSCMFSHEAGYHVWEELYERSPEVEPSATADRWGT